MGVQKTGVLEYSKHIAVYGPGSSRFPVFLVWSGRILPPPRTFITGWDHLVLLTLKGAAYILTVKALLLHFTRTLQGTIYLKFNFLAV